MGHHCTAAVHLDAMVMIPIAAWNQVSKTFRAEQPLTRRPEDGVAKLEHHGDNVGKDVHHEENVSRIEHHVDKVGKDEHHEDDANQRKGTCWYANRKSGITCRRKPTVARQSKERH